jgi:hypothetical protein
MSFGRTLLFLILLFFVPNLVWGQDRGDAYPLCWRATHTDTQGQEGAIDREFIFVSVQLVASTIFDVETTFRALERPGTRELNPAMRPLVSRGRPATYIFGVGVDAGVIYLSYHMKRNPHWRKLWWIIPVIVSGMHIAAGSNNLRFLF